MAKTPPRAARSEVEFVNPRSFSDARVTDRSYESSLATSLPDLRKYILQMADAYLPDNTFIRMRVTEIKDAGTFPIGRGGRRFRVTTSNDPGIIEFDYQWVTADGRVLRAGHERLVDTFFSNGRLSGVGGDTAVGDMPVIKRSVRNWLSRLGRSR